jgi:hypothetical protein
LSLHPSTFTTKSLPAGAEQKKLRTFPALFLRPLLAIIAGNVLNFFCSAPAGNDLVVNVDGCSDNG